MKVEELRVGNCLYNNGVVVRIDARSIFDIWDDKGLKNYQPILLTEEWLIKFGLNETKDQDLFRVNYVNYHKGSNTFSYCIDYYFSEEGYVENMFKEIKYVHELQNLYFALTGSNLEPF